MSKILNKVFLKIVAVIIFLMILYILYQWSIHDWTMEMILIWMYEIGKYLFPGIFIFYVIYKTFVEKIILHIQRNKSAKVIAEELNPVNQVSGPIRGGKDASTTGASIIVKAYVTKKERKEMKSLTYNLYIYNFKAINKWLDIHGKRFFVASDMRINKVFESMIRENDCFISDYWKAKGIKPREHIRSWKYAKGKYIPDVAFNDGLTPGGKHFLELLKRYVLMYVYYRFIPNFIMSNQPILEHFTVVKKTGKIKALYSKIFSQDYIKLKEDKPMPFPMRGFIIETETAILYSNTDKQAEEYFKNESGMREFMTTIGHLLREMVYYYGITQSPTRTMRALRELYPGYHHVFKMKFRATSDFTRKILDLRILRLKLKIFRLKLFRGINIVTAAKIRFTLSKYLKIVFKRSTDRLQREITYTRKIQKTRRKISRLSQKQLQKWAKGYLIFYKGIYEDISDVGKKVSFPIFGVIHENRKATTTYQTYGFKQVNKIKDCFGRYDTHFIKTVREAKEILFSMHFNDVPNWEGFGVVFDNIQGMNYNTFLSMFGAVIRKLEQEEKDRKKQRNEWKQRLKNVDLPDFIKLTDHELNDLLLDLYGPDYMSKVDLDLSSPTYRADIIGILAQEYKTFKIEK